MTYGDQSLSSPIAEPSFPTEICAVGKTKDESSVDTFINQNQTGLEVDAKSIANKTEVRCPPTPITSRRTAFIPPEPQALSRKRRREEMQTLKRRYEYLEKLDSGEQSQRCSGVVRTSFEIPPLGMC